MRTSMHCCVAICSCGFMVGIAQGGVLAPVNDDCANAIEIFEHQRIAFSTLGATTDGPPHDGCLAFGDPQVNQDIWFRFHATKNDLLEVSLCEKTDYDSRLAVYLGVNCDLSDATLVACNDDNCGLKSSISVSMQTGACYTIRVGGYLENVGTGILRVGPSAPCEMCCGDIGSCCSPHPWPNCVNPICCQLVCQMRFECCWIEWDSICAQMAQELCNGCIDEGDVNNDGIVNVDDLLAVINSWGECLPCAPCDADLNFTQIVDVDDLLMVINNWS